MFKYISTYIFVKLALRRRLTINCFCISTENESLNVYVIFLSQIFLKQNSITLYTLILKSRGLNLFLRYSRIFKPKYILEWFYSECPSPRRLIISTTYVFMYNVLIFFGPKIMLKSENMGPTFVHPWLSHVLHIQQCHFSLKTNTRMHVVTVMKCIYRQFHHLVFFKKLETVQFFFNIGMYCIYFVTKLIFIHYFEKGIIALF